MSLWRSQECHSFPSCQSIFLEFFSPNSCSALEDRLSVSSSHPNILHWLLKCPPDWSSHPWLSRTRRTFQMTQLWYTKKVFHRDPGSLRGLLLPPLKVILVWLPMSPGKVRPHFCWSSSRVFLTLNALPFIFSTMVLSIFSWDCLISARQKVLGEG